MTVGTELSEILAMRLEAEYQAAERIRQHIGAAHMASYPPDSDQHASFRRMIGTWELIAARVEDNAPLRIPFYQNNPVNYMWLKLLPGIKIVRKDFHVRARNHYAGKFEKLNRAYMAWLKKQPGWYRSAAHGGIHAQFG